MQILSVHRLRIRAD